MISIGTFIGVVVAAEVFARMLLPSLPTDVHTWPRAEIGQKLEQIERMESRGEQVDVLFAGSSLVAAGINPQLFTQQSGLTSYNAAFAGSSMRTVARWVLDIVEPKLSPEVIVIGMASRDVNDGGPKNLTVYESFMNSPGYKQETASLAHRLEGSLEDISIFLRYRRRFREPTTLIEENRTPVEEQRIRKVIGPRGLRVQEPKNYALLSEMRSTLQTGALSDFSLGGAERDAIVEMQDQLQARGVELMLLDMPVNDDYVDAHEAPRHNMVQYRAFVDRLADETGAALIDAQKAFATTIPYRDILHIDTDARDALTLALAKSWDELRDGVRMEVTCARDRNPRCSLQEVS
jgi:hypothetical protein